MFVRFFVILVSLMLTLTTATAEAQGNIENDVQINQIGTDNAAGITQIGARNIAGLEALPLVQDGIYNALEISQTGVENSIGHAGDGLFQFGWSNTTRVFNSIEIIQNSDGNAVGSVVQWSDGAVTNGANKLVVRQSPVTETSSTLCGKFRSLEKQRKMP